MKQKSSVKKAIDAYFASRSTPVLQKDGTPVTDRNGEYVYEMSRPPTVTGLARALGYPSREEMLAEGDKKSAEAIASALLAIEEYAEEKLFFKESFSGTKLFLSVNFPRWRTDAALAENADAFPDAFEAWAK